MSETREIPLSQGKVAIVDAADFDFLNQWKWSAILMRGSHNHRYYAVRTVCVAGKQTAIQMHRVLMEATSGQYVDHRDNDGLNNRRRNLRLCTNQQNSLNHPGHHAGRRSSQFKGVYWQAPNKKWRARFRGKHVGIFASEQEAARAYDRAAYAFSPDFAFLNFPEEIRGVESH